MATNKEIKKKLEKKGWKFQFVYSQATAHLKKAPVIATKGTRTVKGSSLTDVFRKI